MINPIWFARNVVNCLRITPSTRDLGRALLWTYADKLPRRWKRDCVIAFRYPQPIGVLSLLVRPNGGSDGFSQGEVFHHRYYDLPLPHAPATILDLGANAGFTAVFFSRVYPTAHIAAVEPAPDNLRVLRRNLELNGIAARVIGAAVGVVDGQLTLALGPMDYGHKIVEARAQGREVYLQVQALSVPTIMRILGWARIGLLKVDIEGYESELLRPPCDWLHQVDALCIECHDGFGEYQLKNLAQRYGFRVPQALPGGIWLLHRARTGKTARC
jgi:FkbM family methyltransferase